ncbi:MAG: hypothetical protein C0604_03230 [Clostridiales bacterium]|nr:MAG: hypothetical protein C0604_03230 [Clostridiales bacterium]
MPKKIKNAESKIMDSAEIIFRENGYVKSDMKEIAKYSGVAVGTLYNYWPSKKMLFCDFSKEYWKRVFKKTDEIMKSGVNPRLKSMLFIKNIYDHFEEQLNMKIGEIDLEAMAFLVSMNGVWEEIQLRIEMLMKEIMKDESKSMDNQASKRVARLISLSIISCIRDFPDDKERNLRFINNVINGALEQPQK